MTATASKLIELATLETHINDRSSKSENFAGLGMISYILESKNENLVKNVAQAW